MALQIRVPTGKGDKGSGAIGDSEGGKETNKLLKKLDKTMIANIDVVELLSGLAQGLGKLLEPLIKVLSILFLVIFLPLMPLIVKLTEAVVSIIEGLLKLFGGELSLGEFMKQYLGPALTQIVISIAKMIWEMIKAIASILWETFLMLIEILGAITIFVGEKLFEAFMWVVNIIFQALTLVWEGIKKVAEWFVSIPSKLWEGIKKGWDWLTEKMPQLWETIKAPFIWIAEKMKGAINRIIDFINSISPFKNIPHLAKGGIVNSPTIAMIGEAGPEAVVPLDKMGGMGTTTININNPTVRDESDIRKLTDAISRELQKRGNRGFSA